MEEYINEIREYLPIQYQVDENNEYIDYLITAFIKTSEIGNYQFSFLAFHLLYMSFIYKVIRQSYDQDIKNIRKLISQFESKIGSYNNPFDLSIITEYASLSLLKCFGFHKNKLDEFQSIIRHRDHCAHASGFVRDTHIHCRIIFKNRFFSFAFKSTSLALIISKFLAYRSFSNSSIFSKLFPLSVLFFLS